MQSATNPQYSGIVDCVRKTLAAEGVRCDAECIFIIVILLILFAFAFSLLPLANFHKLSKADPKKLTWNFQFVFTMDCILMVLKVAQGLF